MFCLFQGYTWACLRAGRVVTNKGAHGPTPSALFHSVQTNRQTDQIFVYVNSPDPLIQGDAAPSIEPDPWRTNIRPGWSSEAGRAA